MQQHQQDRSMIYVPLVSTSWSFGSTSTLYSVVMPSLATMVLSAP